MLGEHRENAVGIRLRVGDLHGGTDGGDSQETVSGHERRQGDQAMGVRKTILVDERNVP